MKKCSAVLPQSTSSRENWEFTCINNELPSITLICSKTYHGLAVRKNSWSECSTTAVFLIQQLGWGQGRPIFGKGEGICFPKLSRLALPPPYWNNWLTLIYAVDHNSLGEQQKISPSLKNRQIQTYSIGKNHPKVYVWLLLFLYKNRVSFLPLSLNLKVIFPIPLLKTF